MNMFLGMPEYLLRILSEVIYLIELVLLSFLLEFSLRNLIQTEILSDIRIFA